MTRQRTQTASTTLGTVEEWAPTDANLDRVRLAHDQVSSEIGKVIVGQKAAISDLITTLFAGVHIFFESAPGLGKTLLIRTLPHCISNFPSGMVQCTVDMLPSDCTGFMRFDEETRQYAVQPGKLTPEHCFFLIDEDNRAPGKVQAGFLQIMAEHEIAIGGQVYRLNDLLCIAGTRNPVEARMGTGTNRTIEALADRYGWGSTMMYGNQEEDRELARRTALGLYAGHEPWVEAGCQQVVSANDVRAIRQFIKSHVSLPEPVSNFITEIVRATRPKSRVNPGVEFKRYVPQEYQTAILYGCSSRAIQSLVTLGKTRAAIRGRFHVTEDDIASLAPQVCAHRLVLDPEAQAEAMDRYSTNSGAGAPAFPEEPLNSQIIREIVNRVDRPVK